MRLRSVLFCSLLVLAAVPAAAVERSPRVRSWVSAADAARSVAAIERAREAAGAARATRAPSATRFSGDPRPGLLGTIAWTAGGVPVCPAGIGDQFDATAVSDAAGGVVAAWIDTRQSGLDVYATRLDGNGNPLWSPNGVALCVSDSIMIQPLSVPDGSGGAFVVWGQFSGTAFSDVFVQHVTALGTIPVGWPANGRSTAPGGVDVFFVVPTNDGFLLMGWVDLAGQVRVLRLTDAGGPAPGWLAAGHAVGSSGNFSAAVSGTTDGAGGGYLCWDESGTVMLTRIGAGGTFPTGWSAAGTALPAAFASTFDAAVAPIPGGDVMVFWPDFRNFNTDIYALRYTAAGATGPGWPVDGALALGGPALQQLPDAVPDGAGGAVLVCEVGVSDSMVVQRMTGAGVLAAGWPAAGVTLARSQGKTPSNAIADGLGGALVAWSASGGADSDIFGSRAAPGGAVAVGWPDTLCNVDGSQYDPVIVTDGAAGMIAVWEDGRDSPQLIYAARVTFDGAVGTLASLVSASAEPGIARLHWYTGDGAAFEAGLERARGEGAFVEIARVTAEAGHVRYDDRDVIGGETYRYRLAVREGGTVRHQGAVTLRVPAGLSLSLTGFVPNPVAGSSRLVYALPTAAPARIEVLDLAGRRVHERALDSTAGEHIVAFDGPALAPGVYVLRLTQGTRSATARAVVVR